MKMIASLWMIPCFVSLSSFALSLSKTEPLTWPKSSAKDFGCFLEKEFSHKDKKFNCSLKKYKNPGDPCKDSYYEGPKFPSKKVSQVNPLVESIDIDWEGGEMQSVSLMLKKKLSESEVRKTFALPESGNRVDSASISIQDCTSKNTCLRLQGFEHTGAGDVSCE